MRSIIVMTLCFVQPVLAGEFREELQALMMVESSGGTNLNHKPILQGIHAGTKAGGRFGIMPISGKEFVERNPSPQRDLQYLRELEHEEFTEELNRNEEVDKKLARRMWRLLRQTRTPREAACAWYRGMYSKKCKDDAMLEQDPYVQTFESYMRGPAHDYAQKSK